MKEQRYAINYFDQKEIGYYGTLTDAIDYAESFARNLILSYKGSIVISDENGDTVAYQRWIEREDGSSVSCDWETDGTAYKNLYEVLKTLDRTYAAIVLNGNAEYCFADTVGDLLDSAEADYAYRQSLGRYEVLGTHPKACMVKIYTRYHEGD